jgi:hypothetical protein
VPRKPRAGVHEVRVRSSILIVVSAVLLTGCATRLVPHLAMTASIGCEAADTATTMYYVGAGAAREVNPYLAPVQHHPLAFTWRKWSIGRGPR